MQALQPPPTPPAFVERSQSFSIPDEEARKIDDALLLAEDAMALSLWDEATAALDSLPEEVKSMPHVTLVYLDLFIGQERWHRGLGRALALLETHPDDSELWLRLARLLNGIGDTEAAHFAVSRCLLLNPECAGFLAKSGLLPEGNA